MEKNNMTLRCSVGPHLVTNTNLEEEFIVPLLTYHCSLEK